MSHIDSVRADSIKIGDYVVWSDDDGPAYVFNVGRTAISSVVINSITHGPTATACTNVCGPAELVHRLELDETDALVNLFTEFPASKIVRTENHDH